MRIDRRQILKLNQRGDTMKQNRGEILLGLAPKIVRLGIKAIRYSKDGFTKEELRDLGTDLLEAGLSLLEHTQTVEK